VTTAVQQWSLQGEYLEACNCDWGCPCKFGASPSKGYCQGIIGFEVQQGSYGQVDLGGLGMALILSAPGSPFMGNITATIYVDERATPDQRQAFESIVSGKSGGFWEIISSLVSDNRGIKFAPMQMENSGSRRTFTIPGLVTLVNEPLVNPVTQQVQEVMVSNSFDPFCVSGRAGKSVTAVSSDPDLSFDVTGQQGYIGSFSWAGP
jgi:hypothetical protein